MIFIFMGVLHRQKPPKSGSAPKPQANNSVSLRELEGRIWHCCRRWWHGRRVLCQFKPPELYNLPIQIALWTLSWEIYQVVVEDCGLLTAKITDINACEMSWNYNKNDIKHEYRIQIRSNHHLQNSGTTDVNTYEVGRQVDNMIAYTRGKWVMMIHKTSIL